MEWLEVLTRLFLFHFLGLLQFYGVRLEEPNLDF